MYRNYATAWDRGAAANLNKKETPVFLLTKRYCGAPFFCFYRLVPRHGKNQKTATVCNRRRVVGGRSSQPPAALAVVLQPAGGSRRCRNDIQLRLK